jgi:hypothetical protein
MEPQTPQSEPDVIAKAQCDIRDSWVLISIALKGHVADTPSPLRDEVGMLVERQLARLREGERGNFK